MRVHEDIVARTSRGLLQQLAEGILQVPAPLGCNLRFWGSACPVQTPKVMTVLVHGDSVIKVLYSFSSDLSFTNSSKVRWPIALFEL